MSESSSFNKLMRSIQDKKSIKNLKVPSPAERKAMETPAPKKTPVVEATAPVDMGKTVQANFASSSSAHMWLNSKTKTNEDFDFDAHNSLASRVSGKKGPGNFHLKRGGAYVSSHASEKEALDAWQKLKDNRGVKMVKEDTLSEDVYKVEHEGHPDAATNKMYGHLPVGKKYTNHMTKYEDSAKKAAASLRKAGFKGVKIYKNWKLMEEVELALEEAFDPNKKHPHGGSVMVGVNPRLSGLSRYEVLFAPNKDPKKLTRGRLKTRTVSGHDDLESARKAADDYAKKFSYKRMKPISESIKLEEGKMSELHATISHHLDKHIDEYKRTKGAEALMAKAAAIVPKVARAHGLATGNAEKYVSSYIDSKLNESVDKSSKSDDAKLAVAKWKTMKSRAKLVIDPDKKYKSKTAKDTIKKQTFYEETEQLDEVSGELLGRYIQAARKDKEQKRTHSLDLDNDEKVKALKAKISDFYSRKEYTRSGESKHRAAIDRARDAIETRKKKVDPEYPKSTNFIKRNHGINAALEKLKSGKLSEENTEHN